MTYRYPHHIAILVPANKADEANAAFADHTGRPEDLATFRDEPGRVYTAEDGARYLLAVPACRPIDAQVIADSADPLDAHYTIVSRWKDGRPVRVAEADEWAAELGLVSYIDLNEGTAAQLETLPGVGASTAQAIIDERPYDEVDDLTRASGIGPASLEDIRPWVVV